MCDSTYMSSQIQRYRKSNSGFQGLGIARNGEFMFNGCRISVGEDKGVLEMGSVDDSTTV